MLVCNYVVSHLFFETSTHLNLLVHAFKIQCKFGIENKSMNSTFEWTSENIFHEFWTL